MVGKFITFINQPIKKSPFRAHTSSSTVNCELSIVFYIIRPQGKLHTTVQKTVCQEQFAVVQSP